MRFLRTPGIETHQESHPGRGARSPRHPFRVRIPELSKYSRGTQKTRTPGFSQHRSAVRNVPNSSEFNSTLETETSAVRDALARAVPIAGGDLNLRFRPNV